MAQNSNESIDNDLRYQVLKAKMEADQIKKGYWFRPTPIDPTNTTRLKEIRIDKLHESEKLDVEKVLTALDKIAHKLLDYKYPDAHNILNLKEFITSDRSMIKGTHLDKEYINQVIYRVDRLINDAEDDLDASELMVLYFGIYLARIKNKEIRQVKISRRI